MYICTRVSKAFSGTTRQNFKHALEWFVLKCEASKGVEDIESNGGLRGCWDLYDNNATVALVYLGLN